MSRRGYEEIDIRERRRTSDREPDFLREDYGRSSAGPLVLRDDRSESIEFRSRERARDRPRERETVDREEIIVSRGPRERERPRERDYKREEITYRSRDKPVKREVEREEIIYRQRENDRPPPQQIAREREEYVFRARPREPSYEREEITIREREKERERPRERDYKEEEIVIGRDERERERPRERGYREEEIIIRRDERERERPREKDYKDEEIAIRRDERARERPWEKDYTEEEIIIRRDEKEKKPRPKERDRGSEKDEIIIRRGARDRDGLRPRAASYERESISIRSEERERPRARSRDYREEDITIRRSEREKGSRDFREEEITIRKDERERERPRERSWGRSRRGSEEDIVIRHDDNNGRHKDEVIIRRNEREPSPEYVPPPEPEPIRAPPIHQEIITHHRHIDHGFERAPAPAQAPTPAPAQAPPKPKSPSPKSSFEEIEIRRRGSRNGRHYDEDILIERDTGNSGRRRNQDERVSRPRRSPSPAPRSAYNTRDELDIAEEAEYYNQRMSERSYIGEAFNGATKDWAIVDVPPGTKRVQLEGIGGAAQEVTWSRYNGVRRSKFIADDDVYTGEVAPRHEHLPAPPPEDTRDRGRRFVAQKPRADVMWTEITKDLVVKEAIEQMGYDFEETEFFYYVMSYLRYEDVLHLVELTEAYKRDRRDRIREIEYERRERPRKSQLTLGWDEEKIYEREVVYEGPPRGGGGGGRYR